MPQFDLATFPTQIFWLAVSFFVLYLLMARVALPRINRVLEERQRRIDDNLDRAQALKDEADAAKSEYERVIGEARETARAAIAEASQEMAAEAQQRREELERRLTQDIKAAEARIDDAKDRAIAGLRDAAIEVATSAANRLLGTAPSPDAIAAAVDSAIAEGGRR
jgi:F-type H+-transporting ATPase subunit b